MRLTDRRVILCAVSLGSFFCGCGVIGPSPWIECGADLQECCGGGACNSGLECMNGTCTSTSPSRLDPDAGSWVFDSGTGRVPVACGGENQACCDSDGGAQCHGNSTCQSGSCRSAPMADLTVNDFDFAKYPPTSSKGMLYLCLNQDVHGKASAKNNFIRVDNDGMAGAPSFEVEVGIIGVSSRESYPCPFRFVLSAGLPLGDSVTWSGPVCCKIDCRLVPAGSYEVFVLADPSNAVAETSLTNNLLVKSDPLWIP